MTDRIVLRVGESLVAGGPPNTAAEPEVAIGKLDGPFGTAFANLLGNQVAGHTRVLALLNTDVMVRPPTLRHSHGRARQRAFRRHSQGQGRRPRHHRLDMAQSRYRA